MTQSTVRPGAIKLWKIDATETGITLDLSAHWNAKQITVEDDQGSRQEWEYNEIRFVVPYEGSRAGVEAWLVSQEARILLVAKTLWEAKHDQRTLTADEAKQLADYVTQERIRTAMHPLAGAGEEIKALREEIKALRQIAGGTATSDFQRLDDIAEQIVAASVSSK